MATECQNISWDNSEFNVGYIPFNQDVIRTGLLSITASPDLAFTAVLSISADCTTQIKFPNNAGVYNQDSYSLNMIADSTEYVPFRINLGTACGEFLCEIKYIFEYEDAEGNPVICEGSTNVKAYNASCDFEECLLKASEAYCNMDHECTDDICDDPCYQRFIRLALIDDILGFKITQKDWATVNNLYDIALNQICNCDCYGNVKTDKSVNTNIEYGPGV